MRLFCWLGLHLWFPVEFHGERLINLGMGKEFDADCKCLRCGKLQRRLMYN
jgi:hypothetical protein